VAAHRAIALALAASEHVFVRPSRREPHFARGLAAAAPGLFGVVTAIEAAVGDQLWAYGGDTSLAAIAREIPAGVLLRAQGPGFGVAVVDAEHATAEAAEALARDVAPFEQRGCLSPRAVLVAGSGDDARRFATLVAAALTGLAREVPAGRLDAAEAADARAFRDARAYAGELFPAGPGVVALGGPETLELAPVGRNLMVTPTADPAALLGPAAPQVTAVGYAAGSALSSRLGRALPEARQSRLGGMQRPRFDGPADRRIHPGASRLL